MWENKFLGKLFKIGTPKYEQYKLNRVRSKT